MSASSTNSSIPFVKAFLFWLKLGFISFGGPAGQIALMHKEVVEQRRWISEQRFLHALNYCMLLPGPEATQLAIYMGWLMHRTWGGIVAGLLFLLPSLAILILLSWIYAAFGNLPVIAAVFYGIKPAVVAIVAAAAWRLGSRTLKNSWLLSIAVAAFAAIAVFAVPFPFIIVAAAMLGAVGHRIAPGMFLAKQAEKKEHGSFGPALIDDDTPVPAHAVFSWRRLISVCMVGIALLVTALVALALLYGWASPFTQMGIFFTKAALLTFGGGYAVLPYVYRHAVDIQHWITSAQMIDGLALGETTPGPLIMIVAFVGFTAGWGKASTVAAGITGACIAAFFTFLPSFVFILAGGPVVESTRGNTGLAAPLTAISAAIVGVIASLAVFFAAHVFRGSFSSSWDFYAIAITLASCVALLRYRLGTIPLLGICSVAGLAISFLR